MLTRLVSTPEPESAAVPHRSLGPHRAAYVVVLYEVPLAGEVITPVGGVVSYSPALSYLKVIDVELTLPSVSVAATRSVYRPSVKFAPSGPAIVHDVVPVGVSSTSLVEMK